MCMFYLVSPNDASLSLTTSLSHILYYLCPVSKPHTDIAAVKTHHLSTSTGTSLAVLLQPHLPPALCPSLLNSNPWHPLLCLHFYNFVTSRMLHKEKDTIFNVWIWPFFSLHNNLEIHSDCLTYQQLFLCIPEQCSVAWKHHSCLAAWVDSIWGYDK